MPERENLEWLIFNYGEFLQRFGYDQDKIINGYPVWMKETGKNSISEYLFYLLGQAGHFINQKADTEEEYYNLSIELNTKMLECSIKFKKGDSYFWLQKIHLDKLTISRILLPFKFNVQIDSKDCCSYCSKNDEKIITLEKAIEKKYLPFAKCRSDEGCKCSYFIIPIYDENGKLVPKDV